MKKYVFILSTYGLLSLYGYAGYIVKVIKLTVILRKKKKIKALKYHADIKLRSALLKSIAAVLHFALLPPLRILKSTSALITASKLA